MILSASNNTHLSEIIDAIGIGVTLKKSNSVLIKINLARPPESRHPRTDLGLLANVIQYCTTIGVSCAIAEGANGFLQKNIESTGSESVVRENNVKVIDLDLEDAERVMVEGQGEMVMQEILVGDNALELDRHLLKHFDLEPPEYIVRLLESDSRVKDVEQADIHI
jgi:uncharacterized protein (DUF362 family)